MAEDGSAVRIGTAGWSVPARYADACPGPGTHLERYAGRLDAVEIDTSFYRPHRRATYQRWAAAVPEAFRFAVKLPMTITHERGLAGCEDLLERFAGEVDGLGHKLGVLLVQLPPRLAFDAAAAEAFLTLLKRRIPADIACEPRHASWFGVPAETLLARLDVCRVAADPPPAPGAGTPGGARRLAYFRLHGGPVMYRSDYDAAALDRIARSIAAERANGAGVWCIFDNTAEFAALGDALALQALCCA